MFRFKLSEDRNVLDDVVVIAYGAAKKSDLTGSVANVKMGDINADGKLSAIDARMILQYAAENIGFTPEQVKRADMNGDGHITAFDARATLQAAAQED